jgi:hypothetical protein
MEKEWEYCRICNAKNEKVNYLCPRFRFNNEKKMKKTIIALICICIMPVCWGKQHSVVVNELIGMWVFEKMDILDSHQANAQNASVKASILQTSDLQPYAFCFYNAILNLNFLPDDRLMFESLGSSQDDAEYRLRVNDDGSTQLEILVRKDGQDVPVPTGNEYLISLEGRDRLKITSGGGCLNGESMVCYLKRI